MEALAATGHRPNKLNNEYNNVGPCSEYLINKFKEIILEQKPVKIISGMAIGVDTLWALTTLEMGIPLTAAIPFIGQEKMWPPSSQKVYNEILSNPLTTKVIVCEGGYAPWKMQKRNAWMVDNCTKLVAVWDGSSGGTGNCVRYAKLKSREIIQIEPNGFRNKKQP